MGVVTSPLGEYKRLRKTTIVSTQTTTSTKSLLKFQHFLRQKVFRFSDFGLGVIKSQNCTAWCAIFRTKLNKQKTWHKTRMKAWILIIFLNVIRTAGWYFSIYPLHTVIKAYTLILNTIQAFWTYSLSIRENCSRTECLLASKFLWKVAFVLVSTTPRRNSAVG